MGSARPPDSLDRVSTESSPESPQVPAPPRGHLVLVVQNDPDAGTGRLGGWLTGAGLTLVTCRPYAAEPLPPTLDGYAAVLVLGGDQSACPGPDGAPGAPWFPALESLLRAAVRYRVPVLGVGLGAQLLASATGGVVGPASAGPEFGAGLVARRDAAGDDPLFAEVPFAPDVVQWHQDEVTELPRGAVLLAVSSRCQHQAFRIGPAGWGVQFHLECDLELAAGWAMGTVPELLALGLDPVELLAGVERVLPDLAEVWQPVAERFAALALGRDAGGRRNLPLTNQ